jgi:hypothetical protein
MHPSTTRLRPLWLLAVLVSAALAPPPSSR